MQKNIGKALVIIETLLDTPPGAPERAAIWHELDECTRDWNKGRSYPPVVRARLREVGLRDYPLQRPGAERYTNEPGRAIHLDGKAFITILREGATKPVEGDYIARAICRALNSGAIPFDRD